MQLIVLCDQPVTAARSCCDIPDDARKITENSGISCRASARRIGGES